MKTIYTDIYHLNIIYSANAVKQLCALNDEYYQSPSTTIKVGQILIEICKIKQSHATRDNNEGDRK